MPLRPLQPFSAQAHLAGISLACSAERSSGGVLQLRYQLTGPLQTILLPSPGTDPQRRDGLWQSTCFEAFLATPGQPNYWEINLSPNGDWNVYALSAYRTDLRPEPLVSGLPFKSVLRRSDPSDPDSLQRLELNLSLDLRPLIPPEEPVELSATAVLEHQRFGCSYWAWQHTGPEADFHRRDSFVML